MHMGVVVVLVVMTAAQLITHTLSCALEHMHKVFFLEQGESPENATLVDSAYLLLQLGQGERTGMTGHNLHNYNAVGCGTNTVAQQYMFNVYRIHDCKYKNNVINTALGCSIYQFIFYANDCTQSRYI